MHASEPKPEARCSVLTLTYNHAPFIAQTIESVLAQKTDTPVRHIIVDDGSSDGTRDIVMQYAAKHSSIVPLFRPARDKLWPCGPYGNVRTLFESARTEYVALCDGDDYFTAPHKLQRQMDFLDEHKDCALCFHVVRVTYADDPGKVRFYPPVQELPRGVRPFYYLSDLIKGNLIQTNSVMYRWRFRDGLPDWFRVDLTPGDWYWHLLHAEQGKLGFINEEMSVYRRHKGGIYHLSETDRIKHRATTGLAELEVYSVVNKHFKRRFEPFLLNLACGVFADCLMYDAERAENEGAEPVLPKMCDTYPEFARYFLAAVKATSARKTN